jgi:hypothetical protein
LRSPIGVLRDPYLSQRILFESEISHGHKYIIIPGRFLYLLIRRRGIVLRALPFRCIIKTKEEGAVDAGDLEVSGKKW